MSDEQMDKNIATFNKRPYKFQESDGHSQVKKKNDELFNIIMHQIFK